MESHQEKLARLERERHDLERQAKAILQKLKRNESDLLALRRQIDRITKIEIKHRKR